MWRIPGFERYLIFYRPIPEGIEVIRVLHAARAIAAILEHEE
jgi:toxin ParE1/3/4